jgi:hypothetical protein
MINCIESLGKVNVKTKEEMENFYISYGVDSVDHPYKEGYTKVKAKTKEEAIRKHEQRYGKKSPNGFPRFCTCYCEESFKNSKYLKNATCHDEID